MKQLVVYYSRPGTARKVAEAIVEVLGCDFEEIRDLKDRSGVLGWLSSGRDATLNKLTKIDKPEKPPELYSVTIIGTPVWNSRVSTPIRTYIYWSIGIDLNKSRFSAPNTVPRVTR